MNISRSITSRSDYAVRWLDLLDLAIIEDLQPNCIQQHKISFDLQTDKFLYSYYCLQTEINDLICGEYHYRKTEDLFTDLQERTKNIFMSQNTAAELITAAKHKLRIAQVMISNNHFQFLSDLPKQECKNILGIGRCI